MEKEKPEDIDAAAAAVTECIRVIAKVPKTEHERVLRTLATYFNVRTPGIR